tara:strand:+ start:884 stop:1234 length:351 start_codon:yes stop_codon:yes gene_type:complete
MITSSMAWFFVFLAGVNSCIGNLLLKQARLSPNESYEFVLSPWFLSGLLFYAANVVLFAKSLERLPVSTAYPTLAAVGFTLLVLSASVIFGERLNQFQFFGLFLVVTGIFFLAYER